MTAFRRKLVFQIPAYLGSYYEVLRILEKRGIHFIGQSGAQLGNGEH
jgi:hypothetical protein